MLEIHFFNAKELACPSDPNGIKRKRIPQDVSDVAPASAPASSPSNQYTAGPWTRLHRVVKQGTPMDMVAVLSDSSLKFNINQGNPDGVSPLSLAARRGSCTMVEQLLEHGASVTTVDSVDRTALHHSAYGRHGAVSSMLLDADAVVDETDKSGRTPLILAADEGSVGVIAVLLRRGANVNYFTPIGKMALSCAAFRGHVAAFKMLVCSGADPAKDAGLGMIPLEMASCEGHAEIVSWLLQRFGREVCGGPHDGIIALVTASTRRHYAIMTILLDAGVVDDGRTLLLAINQRNVQSVKFLLEHRAHNTVNAPAGGDMESYLSHSYKAGSDAKWTPLYQCFHPEALTPTSCKIMRLLLDHGADTSPEIIPICSGRIGTILQYSQFQLFWGGGDYDHTMAEKPRMYGLKGLYRLLVQEEAIHATSWLWPNGAGATPPSTTAAHKKMLVTVRLKIGTRPRFLRAAITRFGNMETNLASNRIQSNRIKLHFIRLKLTKLSPPGRPPTFKLNLLHKQVRREERRAVHGGGGGEEASRNYVDASGHKKGRAFFLGGGGERERKLILV